MKPFEKEKIFLNKKLLTSPIEWKELPSLAQVISPSLNNAEIKNIISSLRDSFNKKAAIVFRKMVYSVDSKLNGGTRVVVVIPLLREFFADEIDSASGGGGRGLTPLQTRPRAGSR